MQAERANPDGKICVLLNLRSGKRKDKFVRETLQAALDRHPGRFELRILGRRETPDQAARKAIEDGFDTIAAAGGDGTISAVAAEIVAAERIMGILPMGTFNFFARGLGVPEEIEAAVDLLATGDPIAMSVGEVNGRVFLNNASIGLYPAILEQREGIYRRWGRSRLAAHWSVLVTFLRFHRPLKLGMTVDGVEKDWRTPLIFVARSAFQLDEFGLEGAEEVRQDRFAVFVSLAQSRWELLVFTLRLAWRQSRPGRDFALVPGSDVTIESSRRKRSVARDGERERMKAPFRFRILKDALRIVAPQ